MVMTEVKEEVKIGPFPHYPEGSDVPGVRPILEKTSALSRRSRIRIKNPVGETFERMSQRPDALRRTRRELAEELKTTPKDERGPIIRDAHARDELAEEFISNQQEVRVDMGDLGEQMARFIVLTPPENRKTWETDSKPPIFLISGISNDLESMGMLPQEIAFRGRKVVTIAYPESWRGEVTEEFANAAQDSATFEPHVSFFRGAIDKIMKDSKEQIGEQGKIELWGYSAGALMVSEMLTNESFAQKVSDAAIVAPASNFDRKGVISVGTAILADQLKSFGTDFKNMAKLNPNNRGKIEFTADKRKRMQKTFDALYKKVLRKNNWWEQDMKVSEGGKIVVVSYGQDDMTRTKIVEDNIRQNPNLHLISLLGTHQTPKIESEALISAVNSAL